jgi:proteasome ATPase
MTNGFDGGFGGRGFGGRMSQDNSHLQEELADLRASLEHMETAPCPRATVVSVTDRFVLLAAGSGSILEVPKPGVSWASKLKTGVVVKCLSENMAILGIVENPESLGEISTVRTDGKGGFCEIDYKGNAKLIRYGFSPDPEAGDRIVVDSTGSVAIKSLGKDDTKFSFTGTTGISWDDIGGLDQAKLDLQEAVELPFKYAELYKAYGKKPARGVMLYGPPGCGKTLLAKAVATAMSKIHGGSAAETGFIYVKGPELLDKFVGMTEAQIRALFSRTRNHYKKHKYPAVLFIDEADALLGKRDARLNMGTETTVVPQFLSEMDGLDDAKCVILLATNRPDTLDPAVTREGRVDIKVRVTRPEQKDVEAIMRLSLSKIPTIGDPMDKLVELGTRSLLSPSHVLYEITLKTRKTEKFTLANMISGAMVATMVDKATTLAIHDDIKRGGPPKGLKADHIQEAVRLIFQQNLHTNHDEALEDFCEPFHDQVEKIRRPNEKSSLLLLS